MVRLPLAGIAAALLFAAPAFAQSPTQVTPGRCAGEVDITRAIEIARGAGIVRVDQAECDDGRWEVEGRDAQNRKIEVDVDPRDGRVVKVERD
ncbi:PepSY domain-containing protein [Falsiroseomonas sp.]|uniref:PepSY domain-containing protein n=1 Tax=Falsiroseomonas sp. TaxID=2870721 RepID=UPI0027204095|nr:PepSY domain-containing protein [Falsiroseomonas sp.]MDO9499750.1 PepSY domain-containing protein [Falsiroseomonas sp.]MDP3414827.1 PepSY domain-containing protein [Falsiroseomonas sp.]